jgi:uncharacterized protein (TIGR03118 family)
MIEQASSAAPAASLILGLGANAQAEDYNSSLRPLEFKQSNLVSNLPGLATTNDPLLANPWGVAFQPTGAFWISDKQTGFATLYSGTGVKVNTNFTIPPGAASTGVGQPTGIVANSTKAFLVPGTTLPAAFIFATLDGTISAWAPNLPVRPTNAVLAVDKSNIHGAYTGMDFGITGKGGFLYAANVNTASIDVFDTTFKPAGSLITGKFADPEIPYGFAPFNVRNIDGDLFVTYAKQNATKSFVTTGAGLGFVNVFDTNGNLIRRVVSGSFMNAPWGVARAPETFGALAGSVLIGNFGDGHIFSFDGLSPVKVMLSADGAPVTLPGLWTLDFGGGQTSSPDTLFFTTNLGSGQKGLFGSFTPVQPISDGHSAE